MSIYILLGPEDGEKQNWLERERKKVLSAYPDAEMHTFFGGEDEGAMLSGVLSQSSLFSSFRFAVVKHFENAKKTDQLYQAVAEFMENDAEDAELVIISSETNLTAFPKQAQKIEKSKVITFWELKEEEKKNWIRAYCRREGFVISQAAVNEILDSVDNNTQEMKNLVSSIILFLRLSDKGKSTIDLEEIETYSSRTKGETGYTLFRAIAEGDLEHSLMIVSSILLYDQREMIPAFSVLANQFRLLEACIKMRAERKSEAEIFKNVTYISTYASSKSRPGIFFKDQDTFRKAMRNYSLKEVQDIILYLASMDTEIKSASTEMARITYEEVVYHIVGEKGRLDSPELLVDSL